MDIFLKNYKIKSVLTVLCARGRLSNFLNSLLSQYFIVNFLLASVKLLTNHKNTSRGSEAAILTMKKNIIPEVA
jgi:hypothetical protein